MFFPWEYLIAEYLFAGIRTLLNLFLSSFMSSSIAFRINTLVVRTVINLCRGMKNLHALVHVSTGTDQSQSTLCGFVEICRELQQKSSN